MVDGGQFPNNPDEAAFLREIASEAALAEVSIAIVMRHWSPDMSVQRKAVIHSSKAANLVIQRIKSETAHNGAVLGAVLSMAIGERLLNNTPVWNIHIDGLADIITERRSQGEHDLPALLCNFLIMHVHPSPPAFELELGLIVICQRFHQPCVRLPSGLSQEDHRCNPPLRRPASL